MVRVTVTAPVRPTEVPERVEAACTAFWSDAKVHGTADNIHAVSTDLADLRQRIWELRIIDATRGQLLAGVTPDGKAVRVFLSKQAALHRKISFPPTPSGLGELEVVLTVEAPDPWDDAEALVWWLCPETRDGEIVDGTP